MMKHVLAAAALLLALGEARAAAPSLDRSHLSVDENVIINTICGAARTQGASAYDTCTEQQLKARQDHPSPDRTAISFAQNKAVEDSCDYVRRVGIGDYNQ